MDYVFNHPWELALLLGTALAVVLDLGRRIGVRYQIEQAPQRKEQMGTIRDGLFILVSLLLGFTLTLAASPASQNAAPYWWKKRFRLVLRTYAPARFPSPIEIIPSNCFASTWTPASNLIARMSMRTDSMKP